MYVIVDIQGQQFKVEKDQKKLYVHRMNAAIGDSVEFDKVLLVDNEGVVTVGTPTIAGAKVVVEVIAHVKGDKVLVFHKKRRKGHRKLNGHRQQFTEISVKEIVA
ncbi:MAG: 50S ribosomal protein L21 [Dysgonamonadaceae bacterium]|jgi:large subunit ribosomal protein L21|nr:50S ribosomal protein L21 [Dysgonamonadaceae bacterium]